jgi:hypothetical protein
MNQPSPHLHTPFRTCRTPSNESTINHHLDTTFLASSVKYPSTKLKATINHHLDTTFLASSVKYPSTKLKARRYFVRSTALQQRLDISRGAAASVRIEAINSSSDCRYWVSSGIFTGHLVFVRVSHRTD